MTQKTQASETTRELNFRKHVPALDGIRGIAILAVFFYHYAGGLGKNAASPSAAIRALSAVFGFGWSGVDLFFVLSGFLITGILYDTRNDPGYYKKFYVRRILRIFPIYYLFVIAMTLLAPFVGAHWKPAHLFFLVYLGYPSALVWPALVQVSPVLRITHLWSLSVEEQFYMAWPWLILKLRNPKTILRMCLVVGLSALSLRVVIWATGWLNGTWAYTFLLCRMDTLALGAAIAILVRGPLRERIQAWAPFAFALPASLVVILCTVRHTVDHNDPLLWTVGFSVITAAYGAFLVLSLREGGWLEWLLSLWVLRIFGKYSYGLYLYHFPLSVILSPRKEYFIALTHSYAIGAIAFIVFCLLVNILVASASFHLIESPIMRLKSRFNYENPPMESS